MAALRAALEARQPAAGCIHHSDRGSQDAAKAYRDPLEAHGLRGSGNPYDDAKAQSVMKTLKLEAVYPMACETFEQVAANLPHVIETVSNRKRLHSALGYLNPAQFQEQQARHPVEAAA